jgi:hypothetical protein
MLVKEHELGTAYGIIACMLNFGCMILPPIIGKVHDVTLLTEGGTFWS